MNIEYTFLLSKLYLRQGKSIFSNINPIYGLKYLQTTIQAMPTYEYFNQHNYDR